MQPAGRGVIAHDYIDFYGGGERVCTSLARGFGWDLVVGNCREGVALPEDIRSHDLTAYRRAPWRYNFSRIFQLKWAFENLAPEVLSKADTIVFSGSIALFAHKCCRGKKVLYCHTPPRHVYDLRRFSAAQIQSPLKRMGLRLTVPLYRRAYEKALRQMDVILVNSENVRERLQRFLGVNAAVVYPPVDVERFCSEPSQGYYLSTARLDPAKRVRTIVEAFISMPDKKLVVASSGSDEAELKHLARAASNITFIGWVNDERLAELMSRCIATIYIPQDEDFGISPVESMAAGKPVIGVAEGGLRETILDGKSGMLMRPGVKAADVAEAVRAMTAEHAGQMERDCVERAQLFSDKRFVEKMSKHIEADC
ncbi:MAG: glycosyltransferase family 4 protein [Deltaproteobacteria bacterium]|nr:glycosyltransferase family 4 protein [Deltaproteobacteria bacterium]